MAKIKAMKFLSKKTDISFEVVQLNIQIKFQSKIIDLET